MPRHLHIVSMAVVLLGQCSLGQAQAADYLRQVKPLLAARCYACHGALKQEAGLRLDTAASIRRGGDSGSAVAAGPGTGSLLLYRVTESDPKDRMPPEGEGSPLKSEEVAALRAWIEAGAAGPEDEQPEADPRNHWSFRAPTRPAVPSVKNAAWVINPIDAFLAAEHERRGLIPQPPAEKRLLLRRVHLDLVGLPPTSEELTAFAADPAPDAYERAVERLLASPQSGERWGRHWMDVWRYSDWWGLGANVRNSQKHMWHFRDWIIESLNADLGYDEMVRQMLAADELYPEDLSKLRATGFLARHYFQFNRNTWMEETVEHTSKAFLGLTLNCNRCHDHKYDPIKQVEYYRFRAFFEPYQVRQEQLPGEADYERDGIPRVFDCNLDAPTYRFVRGDEKQPVKDEPLEPGVPKLLSFGDLKIERVSLPQLAWQPGLRPWILSNQLAAGEAQVKSAREALEKARLALTAAEAAPAAPPADAPKPTAADAKTTSETPTAAPAAQAAPTKDVLVALARAAVALAEKSAAARELELLTIPARAQADRAASQQPPAGNAADLAAVAARGERLTAAAKAAEDLARAELELLKTDAAKKDGAEKKVAAAREAVSKATQAADQPGIVYTSLRGALKTPESNVETAESQAKPFPRESSGRRSALARWLTDPRHPLTARVAVNHIWARHFGAPLVPTVFDFGRKGTPPTHPELLDWLACELMEHGWSMKHMHRLIVTSNAYRMTSSSAERADPASAGADKSAPEKSVAGAANDFSRDPDNKYYWRMNSTRMEAQVVRDSLLHLAGELNLTLGGPSIDAKAQEFSQRRSLYFTHSHNDHHRFLASFDDADVLECYRREQSIVPQQALALVNSRQSLDAAAKVSQRLIERLPNSTDETFVRAAFTCVLACEPTAAELTACCEALSAWRGLGKPEEADKSQRRARANLVHALLNHNDFITVR